MRSESWVGDSFNILVLVDLPRFIYFLTKQPSAQMSFPNMAEFILNSLTKSIPTTRSKELQLIIQTFAFKSISMGLVAHAVPCPTLDQTLSHLRVQGGVFPLWASAYEALAFCICGRCFTIWAAHLLSKGSY